MEELKDKFLQDCEDNNQEGVRDCLSRGVDVNTLSEDGWSGLDIAAEKNYPELLEIFLSHSQIKIDNKALLAACVHGNSAIVTRLVQVPGLDIMYENEKGGTAVNLASVRGHTECLKILAETGKVDWNKRNRSGRTPLHWALYGGQSDIVDFISQQPQVNFNVKTNDEETLAQAAVFLGGIKCVETLAALDRCDCWNVPDNDGDTPIMKAFKGGKTRIVEILLSCHRVDLRCKDKEGWTLLFRAF